MSDQQRHTPRDFEQLLDAAFIGDPTPELCASLNDQLSVDDSLCRRYAATMLMKADLEWETLPAYFPQAKRPSFHQVLLRRGSEFFTKPTPFSITTAAIVVGILVTSMALMAPPFYRAFSRAKPSKSPNDYEIVAQITGLHDAEWASGQIGVHRGASLTTHRSLDLLSGLAEVTFRSGCRVLLNGPVRCRIEDDHTLRLESGMLVARVPTSAAGFTVATPHSEVIDLGTEFGVRATADGTGVQVFEGRVELSRNLHEPQKHILVAGQAAWISPTGRGRIEAEKRSLAFVRSLPQPRLVIPLGNLFDDEKSATLTDAIATDTYGAEADVNDLGIHSHVRGHNSPIVNIAERFGFDFGSLGWGGETYSAASNDAWGSGYGPIVTDGFRTWQGDISQPIEQGIGMHASQVLTFDLDEIRRAGGFSTEDSLIFAANRIGLNDDIPFGDASAHLMIIVSSVNQPLRAWCNGGWVKLRITDRTWQIDATPEPMNYQSAFAALSFAVPSDARFLSLVTISNGSPGHDHCVFSDVRLIVPGKIEVSEQVTSHEPKDQELEGEKE